MLSIVKAENEKENKKKPLRWIQEKHTAE